jgi:L-ascorbate metabolism protein UlaG (beta-lactamase superfamily)
MTIDMRFSRRKVLAGAAAVGALAPVGVAAQGAMTRYYDGPVSDHFDGLRFFDPHGAPPKSTLDLLRWWSSRNRAVWPEWAPSPHRDRPPARVDGGGLRVSFVGHASMLLQAGGLNILVDPVWSKRVSPLSFVGPTRVNDPGIDFDALPPIDAVLVSHCHYDHLDVPTLSALATHRPRIVMPLGNDTVAQAQDPSIRAEVHDWGSRVVLGPNVTVTLVPMRHWSARGLTDRNKALWAAFVIETPAGRIYHVADSGYGDGHHFRAARERHGPFRLAVLPIGAYEPRWFMGDQHMNPHEAVRALNDCGAESALAHHFGTFQLTDEAMGAPGEALIAARAAAGIPAERFRALAPGQVWDF